jgi:hypothetical protein
VWNGLLLWEANRRLGFMPIQVFWPASRAS